MGLVRAPGCAGGSFWRTGLLLAGYAASFALLHTLAAAWGQISLYSLWYPAAGLKFTVLWRFGPQLAPGLALAELLVHLAWGNLSLPPFEGLTFAASVVFPTLAYGLAIARVRACELDPGAKASASSMPLAIAMACAPALAAASSLPWHLLRHTAGAPSTLIDALSAAIVFLVGDVLGVLLIAPPLLWLLGPRQRSPLKPLDQERVAEAGVATALALGAAWVTLRTSLGLRLEPMVLAVVWVGRRLGTAAAWLVLAPVSAFVLFFVSPRRRRAPAWVCTCSSHPWRSRAMSPAASRTPTRGTCGRSPGGTGCSFTPTA